MAEQNQRDALCAEVARLLREERSRQRCSLAALAERAGLSRQMVSYVEQQKRNPTLDTLLRICDALGISPERLLARARNAARRRA